jgi:hypothetical protein
MTEENTTTTSASGVKASLTDEEKRELVAAIANDIYKRSTLLQIIQLVQTQCTNQAATIIENATDDEIEGFLKQLRPAEEEKETNI